MPGDELLGFRVEEHLLDRAEFPQRFQPVVATLAVELAPTALQDADVAGDVRGARSVAELGPRGRSGEPAVVLVVEQCEHGIAAIPRVAVDRGDTVFAL